ncbi:unnamed protein product [Victoria cruziana]
MTRHLEKGPHLLPAPSSMLCPCTNTKCCLRLCRPSSPSSSSTCSDACPHPPPQHAPDAHPLLQHALNNGLPPSTFHQSFEVIWKLQATKRHDSGPDLNIRLCKRESFEQLQMLAKRK